MIQVIVQRELKSYYATPMAWIMMAGAQLVLSWLLYSQLDIYLKIQPQLTSQGVSWGIWELVSKPTLASAGLMMMLIMPLLGMRNFSAELQSKRIEYYLSSPVTASQLVLGKWLGLLLAGLPLVGLTIVMIFTLQMGASLDAGKLVSSLIGLFLLSAMTSALITWLSSLTRHPAIAAALAYSALFLMWLIEPGSGSQSIMSQLALSSHLNHFLNGQFRLIDIWYFFAMSLIAILLAIHNIWRLEGGD